MPDVEESEAPPLVLDEHRTNLRKRLWDEYLQEHPLIEVRDGDKTYRIWADGRMEGFGPAASNYRGQFHAAIDFLFAHIFEPSVEQLQSLSGPYLYLKPLPERFDIRGLIRLPARKETV